MRNLGDGKFEDVTEKSGLSGIGAGYGCSAGDFDNDGRADLAICEIDGVRLFHNEGAGKFVDVTTKVGIQREKGCVAATFVDYDHDGDLDLYLTFTPGTTLKSGPTVYGATTEILRLPTFPRPRAWELRAPARESPSLTLIMIGPSISFWLAGQLAQEFTFNPREGKFAPLPGIDFTKEKLPPAVGVTVLDFDKDGFMDLAFTHAGAPGITLWRNVNGKRLERVALPDLGWKQGWGITGIDFDNDGWLDLVAVGESASGGEIRLLRNLGDAGFADVTKKVQLDGVKVNSCELFRSPT